MESLIQPIDISQLGVVGLMIVGMGYALKTVYTNAREDTEKLRETLNKNTDAINSLAAALGHNRAVRHKKEEVDDND